MITMLSLYMTHKRLTA